MVRIKEWRRLTSNILSNDEIVGSQFILLFACLQIRNDYIVGGVAVPETGQDHLVGWTDSY